MRFVELFHVLGLISGYMTHQTSHLRKKVPRRLRTHVHNAPVDPSHAWRYTAEEFD